MKFKLLTIITAALVAAAGLACAQSTIPITPVATNSVVAPPVAESVTVTNAAGFVTTYYAQPVASATSAIPTTNGFLLTGYALLNDITTASNYSANVYASYKPSVPNDKAKFGGGLLVIYDVSQHVGVAAGLDYFGGWTLVSGNATFKLAFAPLAGWGFTNFFVIPNAIVGIGTSFGGNNSASGVVEVISGTGASFEFGHWLGGMFDAGGEAVDLSNAGDYSGWDYRLFVGWSKGF